MNAGRPPISYSTRLVGALRRIRVSDAIDVDDGWHQQWDIRLATAGWARLDVRMLVEEHARGACLVRVTHRLRPTMFGKMSMHVLAALAVILPLGLFRGTWDVALVLLGVGLVLLSLLVWKATRAVAMGQMALLAVMAEQEMYVLGGHKHDAPLAAASSTLTDAS